MNLASTPTPAALVDTTRLQHNIERMAAQAAALGVRLRPHVKTTKCDAIVRRQLAAGAQGITVSTLKEAEQFFAAGIVDILYAVAIAPSKLVQAAALRRRGCDLKLLVDNEASAEAIVAFSRSAALPPGQRFEVWIEIDTDGHRSGLRPDDPTLLRVGRSLHDGGLRLGGVMTHAGASYALNEPAALRALAEQERAGCLAAAERLRAAGLPCAAVSVGSTPTALSAARLDGVTELRAGVYAMFDLVMANVGVCTLDEIALSVLTTVIGHQREKGWAIVDAGWMAMSRDVGTHKQAHDFGYGQVCDAGGKVLPGCTLASANQEHGIVVWAGASGDTLAERLPVGTLLRILPNHACATGAQFPHYHAIDADGSVAVWERFHGW